MAFLQVPSAMSDNEISDSEWLEWVEIQKEAIRVSVERGHGAALEVLGAFPSGSRSLAIERQALCLRADLLARAGDPRAALRAFMGAHERTRGKDFERYTIELSLGRTSSEIGEFAEAEVWYVRALETAAADPRTCGISALKALTTLRGSFALSDEERPTVERVIAQSWALHRLPGKPDLFDLSESARAIHRFKRADSAARTKALLD